MGLTKPIFVECDRSCTDIRRQMLEALCSELAAVHLEARLLMMFNIKNLPSVCQIDMG